MYIVLLCMEKGISLPCQSCMQFALCYDPLSSSSATALFPIKHLWFWLFSSCPTSWSPWLHFFFFFRVECFIWVISSCCFNFSISQFVISPPCLPHTLYSFLQTVPDHLWRYEWNQNKQRNNSKLPATPLLRLSLVGTYKRAWPAASLHALSCPYLCLLEFVLPL